MNTYVRRATGLGALIWIIYCGVTIRSLHDGGWAHALLLLAALVVVPVGFGLIRNIGAIASEDWCRSKAEVLQFPAALLLVASCSIPVGIWSALTAIPWTVVCLLAALSGCSRLLADNAWRSTDSVCITSALLFLGVGGAWVCADRAGFRPLDFPDAIVTLTAVHFHFAGFVLPLVAGMTARVFPASRFAASAGIAVCVGVPAVAVGITATQLGAGSSIEALSGGVLALSGAFVAILHLRIATRSDQTLWAQILFGVAGLSLLFGMVLAGIYAFRSVVPILPWLDVPWMRALHGTANALGFGLFAIFAWRSRLMKRTESL